LSDCRDEADLLKCATPPNCQTRVVQRRHIFRELLSMGLLPGRLPGACGYLGGETFMAYEDNMACFTRKWTSDILLRDYDSVCNDFSCTIGNWWSGEKSWTWSGG